MTFCSYKVRSNLQLVSVLRSALTALLLLLLAEAPATTPAFSRELLVPGFVLDQGLGKPAAGPGLAIALLALAENALLDLELALFLMNQLVVALGNCVGNGGPRTARFKLALLLSRLHLQLIHNHVLGVKESGGLTLGILDLADTAPLTADRVKSVIGLAFRSNLGLERVLLCRKSIPYRCTQ